MLELLFLLLPIAAAYGWYMGRRAVRLKQAHQRKKISRDYFTGLNFLLSDQSDKAVDLFISLLDVDDDTIDTHMSLGALFRRRGEVDRAIRIHQNLIARPSLSDEQRDLAMMELGKDYQTAGFYDRAEEIFVNIVSQTDHSEDAEMALIDIYQVTKEWQKAIDVTKKLSRKRQQIFKPNIAHFYCQLAEESSALDNKLKLYHLALKQDPTCGRALLSLAKLYLANNEHKHCQQKLYDLVESEIDLVADAVIIAHDSYIQSNNQNGYQLFLENAINKGAGASVIIAFAKLIINDGQFKVAEDFVLDSLYRHPTMKGFKYLMQLHIKQAEEGQAKQSLTMLEKLVEQQIKYRPSYRCNECGFPSHSLYWQCPSCKKWGTILRIRGLDGE